MIFVQLLHMVKWLLTGLGGLRPCVQGQSVTQIGAQLGLAANTVSTYRARILEKTGTKNDVELALYAERYGHS